jgi:hypothetical protein
MMITKNSKALIYMNAGCFRLRIGNEQTLRILCDLVQSRQVAKNSFLSGLCAFASWREAKETFIVHLTLPQVQELGFPGRN